LESLEKEHGRDKVNSLVSPDPSFVGVHYNHADYNDCVFECTKKSCQRIYLNSEITKEEVEKLMFAIQMPLSVFPELEESLKPLTVVNSIEDVEELKHDDVKEETIQKPSFLSEALSMDKVNLYHEFNLESSFSSFQEIDGSPCEPTFTNYTGGFQGTLDYIFYGKKSLELVSEKRTILPSHSQSVIEQDHIALPSDKWPSDHCALICSLRMK
jgi:hypothetical protein